MPFCPNCGADSQTPGSACPNCGHTAAPAPGTPALSPPEPAKPVPASRFLIGCLAALGGVFAGTIAATFLFWFVAGASGALNPGPPNNAKIFTIVVDVAGLAGLAALVRTGTKRDFVLQIALISTLVTTLGAFSICSTLFWIYGNNTVTSTKLH